MSKISSAPSRHCTRGVRSQGHRIGLLLGLLTAFALRLFQLGSASLWYDETVSVVLARKSIPALLAHTAGDIHPPGYYLLLHFWQQLTTPSVAHGLEFLFAWPSLWSAMLIVALIYPLGRRLFSPAIALLALGLAAIHPYQIWYAQEVRMYTLGALLGLLALWALLNYFALPPLADGSKSPQQAGYWRWLLLYALCGALGLYTLYYFLFLLLSLNAIALLLCLLPRQSNKGRADHRSSATHWVGTQLFVLLVWLPWLPIFWRQAIDPPVPPWRTSWQSLADFGATVSASVSALLSGQSAPAAPHWLWLLIALLLLSSTYFYYTKNPRMGDRVLLLLLYTLFPLGLLLLISLVVIPIYHVRYLILYAAPLVLLPAALLDAVNRTSRPLGWLLLTLLVSLNGWSLQSFWTDPRFQPDDHRAAVAQLAAAWRPGDLILVNAGWVYTVLETYWPTELSDADAAVPPPLQQVVRLHDYAKEVVEQKEEGKNAWLAPVVVRTGSVDGGANLGWGDPASDFFALDAATTTAALQTLRQQYARLWHYRLYDTVNDPAGIIRSWLDEHGARHLDQPIAGRDFLRLQLFAFEEERSAATAAEAQRAPNIAGLRLLAAEPLSATVAAGTTAYLATDWQRTVSTIVPSLVSFSLRLYDDRGVLIAQHDEQPLHDPHTWSTGATTALTLALPIPVATQPGTYGLQLLLYDRITGTPIAPSERDASDALLPIGALTIATATDTPTVDEAIVRFDYIDLLQLQVAQATVTAGETLSVNLLWHPQPNPYQDTYVMQWALRDQAGAVIQSWQEPLGSWHYPSGVWSAAQPVRQQILLDVPPITAADVYQLTMQIVRHSDGDPIAPRRRWWQLQPWQRPPFTILPNATLLVAEIVVQ